MKMLRST